MIADDIRNRKNMSVVEALAYGFRLFKENFVQLMFIMFVIYFPLSLLSGYISVVLTNIENGIDINAILSSTDTLFSFINSAQYKSFAVYNMLNVMIDLFLAPFGAMAVISLVNDYCEGRNTGYKEALSTAFSRGPRFILMRIVYTAAVGVLYILGIIPGVILSVFWAFNLEALVLDDINGIKPLGFSRSIVTGRWFRTFGFLIVCRLMNYGLSYIVSFFFMWGSGTYIAEVLFKVVLAVLNMIFIAAETVIYINFKANPAERNKDKYKRISADK